MSGLTLEKCCQVMTNQYQDQSDGADLSRLSMISNYINDILNKIDGLAVDGNEDRFVMYYDKLIQHMLKVDRIKDMGHLEQKQTELIELIRDCIERVRTKSLQNLKNMYVKIGEKGLIQRVDTETEKRFQQILTDESNATINDIEELRYRLNDILHGIY